MRDTYQTVTDTIIRELETGAAPWVKPWTSSGSNSIPHNASTGREYSGINVLLLWIDAKTLGYSSPGFLTFKQAKERGGNVRAGSHICGGIQHFGDACAIANLLQSNFKE